MRKKSDGDLNLIAVGSRIQQRRKDLHLSQEILAEKAGISTSSLSLIENGHINLSVITLSRIAHELNCTMDDLFYGISNQDAYMEEVKKALADCSDEEKAFLVGLLMDARQGLKELKNKLIE